MAVISFPLEEIYQLIKSVMLSNGCDEPNAVALADIMTRAERDGSHSHGLFRVPGYVKALRSGKVDGKAKPKVEKITPAIIKVNGHGCFAPIAQSVGLPALVEATKEIGIGALTLTGIHHFAALWPEKNISLIMGLLVLPAPPTCLPWHRQDQKPHYLEQTLSPLLGLAQEELPLYTIWQQHRWLWVMFK